MVGLNRWCDLDEATGQWPAAFPRIYQAWQVDPDEMLEVVKTLYASPAMPLVTA